MWSTPTCPSSRECMPGVVEPGSSSEYPLGLPLRRCPGDPPSVPIVGADGRIERRLVTLGLETQNASRCSPD